MFIKSAAFYDAIYAAVGKDYSREAETLHAIIQQYKHSLLTSDWIASSTRSRACLAQSDTPRHWNDYDRQSR